MVYANIKKTLNSLNVLENIMRFTIHTLPTIAADNSPNVPMTAINTVMYVQYIFINSYFFNSVMILLGHACSSAIALMEII
jgi:hypothetical protein